MRVPAALAACLLFASSSAQELLPTGEPARSLGALKTRLDEAAAAYAAGTPVEPEALTAALDALNRAVSTEALTRVDVLGPGFEVPVRGEALFGQIPALPFGERPHRLVLTSAAEMLYVFGIKLEPSRTIRLHEVVLRFRDGSARVHDQWDGTAPGEGKLISAGRQTPLLEGWSGLRRAARLASIEILGAASDPGAAAELTLVFQIPDPDARPFRSALQALATMRVSWPRLAMDAEGLDRRRADLRRLEALLQQP